MSSRHYVACDLGAESGRVMLATLGNGKLTLEEIHRFPTGGMWVNGTYRWDVLHFFEELKAGLRKIALSGVKPVSLSADTWGVDYVLLKGDEPMLTAPFHYRDARTDAYPEKAFKTVSSEEIYRETGLQFMHFNTLYQLLEDLVRRPEIVGLADRMIPIGDYFNYLFSGKICAEVSFVSTTQLYNPKSRGWSKTLVDRFKIPARLLPEIVASGTVLGKLKDEVAKETRLEGVKVVATCTHDTGCAVAGVPGEGDDWAYLSSGTWSLLGVELPEPVITEKALQYNVTNEVGYGHSIRFLKNLSGLWIVQESRRVWADEGKEYGYDELTRMASEAAPLKSLINPTDSRFARAGEMTRKIADFCRETGQPVPSTPGEFVRCGLESLALLYRRTLSRMEELTGRTFRRLHIVGGGSKNALLNQFAANACGVRVLAGPVEATAIGNVLIQAIAMGDLKDLAAARRVIRDSFVLQEFSPQDVARWKTAMERFERLPGVA